MNIVSGILFHTIGAASAALCYTPQKKVQGWSWQTFWLVQAAVCWLILPIVVAYITIPNLSQVLTEAPTSAMIKSFALGMAYGVGGTAFGIAIRYLGFSLTYAIAVGISCVLGTLLGPILENTLLTKLGETGGLYIIIGIILGAAGIALCGIAGRQKEKELKYETNVSFSYKKGLPICILAGILSAFYGLSIGSGAPIEAVADKYGAGQFKTLVIYIFSNTGAFVTTLLYCLYLHVKNKTISEHSFTRKNSVSNYVLAILTGAMWYGQFFFYGLGKVRMDKFDFAGWAIHMILLVLLSALLGLAMKEWENSSKKARTNLTVAIVILLGAVVSLTYANYVNS